MHKQIRRVGLGLLVAFLAVFAQLNYIQIFAAERIASNPANIRALLREYSIERGRILTVDGKIVARSKDTGGRLRYRRIYPFSDLYAHVAGYYSIVFGADRIERALNDELLGEGGVLSMQDIQDRFLSGGRQGDDVRLTIHSQLQQTARDLLSDQAGSVVALDPSTGEIRAMWSKPSFDPGPLAAHDSKAVRAYWRTLDPASPSSPLLNKATSRGFPPGSTLKVLTTAAALESGRYDPSSTFPDPVALELPLTTETLTNFTKTSCTGGGRIDLFTALVVSCDTTFAMIGLEIPDEIREMAEAMGFNSRLPLEISTEASAFPEVPDDEEPQRAYAAIGQGNVNATPLQMALVAATIANGGATPVPHLVREVIDPSGAVDETSPLTIAEPMSPATARRLTEMMVAVVQRGTGTAAQMPGTAVAGKTGTAQTVEGAAPHAWFISFAPAHNPRLAVAVLVENGGALGSEATGGAVAAPIAKAILEVDRRIRGW